MCGLVSLKGNTSSSSLKGNRQHCKSASVLGIEKENSSVKITQAGKALLKSSMFSPGLAGSMVTSLEGLGSDNVFSLHEDNHYRISKSLVKSAEGSTVPLTRVKCLVSMTTPHDIRLHGSSVTPAFVEFDTSLEGFG